MILCEGVPCICLVRPRTKLQIRKYKDNTELVHVVKTSPFSTLDMSTVFTACGVPWTELGTSVDQKGLYVEVKDEMLGSPNRCITCLLWVVAGNEFYHTS